MTTAALIGLFVIIALLIGLAQPVYVFLGTIAAWLLLNGGVLDDFGMLTSIIEMTRRLADNEVLLAIPFFVVAGNLMTEGDIARRLIEVARAMFGWLPGGMAVSATMACVAFAAISGSSPVTVIAIGSIMYPALIKEGYRERFSSGLLTSAGSLGILIPPSIPMIVYAIADPGRFREPPNMTLAPDGVDLGVTDLFLAGIVPGVVIGLVFSVLSVSEGIRRKLPRSDFSWRRLGQALRAGIWSLFLPILILGGIYTGAFTATQAACVAVMYALVVELFIHRSINFRMIHRTFSESFVLIGSLLIIMAVAQALSYYVTRAEVARKAVELLYEMNVGPIGFLLIVNVILLAAGMFMDILSAILILVPLLSPIAYELGIHPLHLGIIFIVNLEIGYLTPPVGINLFVASTLFRKSLGEIIKGVVPFMALMLACLLAFTYVPTIPLGAVSLLHGGSATVPFPEPHIPLRTIQVPEEVKLLSSLAQEAEEAAARPPEPPRVRTLEEIMNQSIQQIEAEEVQSLQYESIRDLLRDYRDVADGRLRIRDIGLRRGGGEGTGD